jgi:hypothetical protein
VREPSATHGLCAANVSKYEDNIDAIRALRSHLDAAVQAYIPQEDQVCGHSHC